MVSIVSAMLPGIAIVHGMQILRRDDCPALPWKNGLGVSRVIASLPRGAGYETVVWQVSTTEIAADCPFSSLGGMDRRFMLLEGQGVELTCSDAAAGFSQTHRVDTPFAPAEFRGDWNTGCRLIDGEVQVLNVMTRRGSSSAAIQVRRWSGSFLCTQHAGQVLLAVMLSGRAQIAGEAAPLVPNDAVLLEARLGERCEIEAPRQGARIALISLSLA